MAPSPLLADIYTNVGKLNSNSPRSRKHILFWHGYIQEKEHSKNKTIFLLEYQPLI